MAKSKKPKGVPIEFDLDYIRSFFKESDRGCMILVGAQLDGTLEKLHTTHISHLGGGEAIAKKLFQPYAPLGSFAGKIQLAYAYGLVGDTAYHDLELIRDLRNIAAHYKFSFSDDPVIRLLFSAKSPKEFLENNPDFIMGISQSERRKMENPSKPSDAKTYSIMVCMCLTIEILQKTCHILEQGNARLTFNPSFC
jgi:hypothetical protein